MSEKPTILIVDDTPANLSLLTGLLKDYYRIKVANNGVKALALAEKDAPDLVLLDIMMPELDGYETCRRMKKMETMAHVPIIFLTAKSSQEDEEMGFEAGAVDFIHKPISPPIVMARVRAQLSLKEWGDMLADKSAWLEKEVERRLSEINRLQEASMMVMVSLAEFRDECTGMHIVRTQEYVRLLAQELSRRPKFSYLTNNLIELYARSAPLHDIGKIAIPDSILLKPGKLTEEEFEVMKTHTTRGYDILKQAHAFMGEQGDFLNCAMDVALNHHERWNGSGYPNKKKGEEIPLSARIMSVADVYDALRTARPYKPTFSREESEKFIIAGKGKQFDPDVIDAFLAVSDDFDAINAKMADAETQTDAQILS